MKKTIVASIIILIHFTYCTNASKDLRKYISNGDSKYWYRYYNDTLKPYAVGYCFKLDGTYIEYCNPDYNPKIRAFCSNAGAPKAIWKLVDDSTLMFGGNVYYRILYLNEDSIVLQSLKPSNKGYLKLHKARDQITRPKRMVYWDSASLPGM